MLSARGSCVFLLFIQTYNQEAIAIVTLDRGMFDGTGEPNHLFKPAIGDFELIMGNPFTAGAVTPRATDAQKVAVDNYFHVLRLHAGQIDFDDPAVSTAIDVSCGTP